MKLLTIITIQVLLFISINAAEGVYNEKYKYTAYQNSEILENFIYDESKEIYTNPTRIKMGNVFMNTKYYMQPSLMNKTKKPVNVSSVRGTCSCTSIITKKGQAKPNDSFEFEFIYNTTGFPKDKNIRKSVWLFSDAIKPKGKTRHFYENIIGFNGATLVTDTKLVEVKKGEKEVTIIIENRSDKVVKNLKSFVYDDALTAKPMDLKPGKNSVTLINNTKLSKDLNTTVTFYAQGDSLCVFSVPALLKK